MNRTGIAGIIWAVTLTLAAGVSSLAPARTPAGIANQADPDRARAELERTDQVLIRAATHLRECESSRGESLLREGRRIQSDAWARFRSTGGSPQEQVRDQRAAVRLTRTARDLAIKAIEACQVEFRAHQAIVSMLESARQLGAEAAETVRASRSEDARRLLDAGMRQLEHAAAAHRNRELRRAITLGTAARKLIRRALQRAQMEAGPGVAERAAVAIDRNDQMIRDTIAYVDEGDQRVSALLERARAEQEQARASYRDGRFEQALRLTQASRGRVLDALWVAQRAPDEARVARGVELVERVLLEIGPEILRSGGRESIRLLEAAEGQIESAHGFLAQGDAAKAAQAVRAADSLLRRAAESAGR